MRLPAQKDLFSFYVDLNDKCNATREDRRKLYTLWRSFFLFGGGPEMTENTVNKISAHIEQLNSLMYSSETTRFSIDLTPSASELYRNQVRPLMESLNDDWHMSNTDMVFGQALMWSFVYGSMFVKLRVNADGGVEPFVVDPYDIGVLREDIQGLWRQEAFTHSYYMTRSQFEYELRQIPHPRIDQILKEVTAIPKGIYNDTTAVMDRIVTSQSAPNMIGNINFDLNGPNKYKPKVAEELLKMSELYVFDDSIGDFRIVTIAKPGVVVFDRPVEKLFIKNEIPFVQVCPNPAHDFFWGYSEVDKLIPLQRMRNERMEQIRHMLNLQANPPKFGSGFQGEISEMADVLDSPGGLISADMPGARMENITPSIPEDLYKEIRELDSMFEEISGITNVMSGKGESGVRSGGHAANLARLGSSRAKKRAMIVEDSLEKLAMLFLQLKQAYDKSRLRSEDGIEFVADQFTDKYMVKVDAHSNSPIFQEDQRSLAFELFKAKAIDRESLIDLLDVPMKELLKQRLQKMEAAEAQQAQQKQAMEMEQQAMKAKPHLVKGGK
jgi:hypothetical protein